MSNIAEDVFKTVHDAAGFTQKRERKSIRELEKAYANGDRKPLSDLLRAWRGIQEKDWQDPNSYFMVAGYHGEPFRGAGWGNPQWWGGYCHHGNVLFPTWHRAYVYRLENALRSVPGCENVAMAYWDETDVATQQHGVPSIFLQKRVELDDKSIIDNPLYSYTFPKPVWDNLSFPDITSSDGATVENVNPDYYKNAGYKTVRYPYSGFTGQPEASQQEIDKYNASISSMGEEKVNAALNGNVKLWLSDPKATRKKYELCLKAENYTVFSNTTSATHWNEVNLDVKSWGLSTATRKTSPLAVVPLESPHNDIHLAVGGFHVASDSRNQPEYSMANGDMGENETASFDPIFFFHHCFVDKTFWEWQKKHDATKTFEIIQGYPGTNSVDSQGPTPGMAGGTWLTLDTGLEPFKKGDKPGGSALTSRDVIDIENTLNYTYIDPPTPAHRVLGTPPTGRVTHHAKISGLNRGAIGGSFIVATYKEVEGRRELLGYESILSRWHTAGCANCQTHLNVKTFLPLHDVDDDFVKRADDKDDKDANIVVEVIPRTNNAGTTLVGGAEIPKAKLSIITTALPVV